MRWKALLSALRSLNCSKPTSPSAPIVSWADSAGTISCESELIVSTCAVISRSFDQEGPLLTCTSCISSLRHKSTLLSPRSKSRAMVASWGSAAALWGVPAAGAGLHADTSQAGLCAGHFARTRLLSRCAAVTEELQLTDCGRARIKGWGSSRTSCAAAAPLRSPAASDALAAHGGPATPLQGLPLVCPRTNGGHWGRESASTRQAPGLHTCRLR